jgi:hypothetical protein
MARYRSTLYTRGLYGRTRAWLYAVSGFVVIVLVCYGLYRLARRPARPPAAAAPVTAEVVERPAEAVEDRTPPAAELSSMPAAELSSPPAAELSSPPAAEPVPEPRAVLPKIAADSPKLVSEALAYLAERPPRIIQARDMLNEALPLLDDGGQAAAVKARLSELAEQWLFSRTVYPGDNLCGTYLVKPGDVFEAIAEQYRVPYEVLMSINRISRAEALRASDTIKVINGPFHAVISRSNFNMDLYLRNTFVRSFPVGLGRPGMDTPTGLWLVKPGGKLIKPTWTDPDTGKTYQAEDPDYPLGSRWIGLEGIEGGAEGRTGFAIHGTKDPSQIGTAGSRGCIRLHNGDAILVYNLLMPGYSRVQVVD